MIEEDSEMPM